MRLPVASARPLLRAFSVASKHHVDMIDPGLRPEVVLSESNRKACIERLKLYRISKVPGDIPEAAVLVPLCIHKGELGILYTLRSLKMTVNRGQVSFPGGKRDKDDADLIETAMRETWEELRIPREKIDVWTAATLLPKKDINVMPVLGYVGEVVVEELDINRDEVEEAFVVSLRKLCDPEQFRYTRFYNSFNLPTYLGGKYRVWGFTGMITHMVLQSLVPRVYRNVLPEVRSLRKNDGRSSGKESDQKRSSVDRDTTRSKL